LDHNADVDVDNQMDKHLFSYAIQCCNIQIINNILVQLPYPAHTSARCGYLSYFEQHDCLNLIDDCGDTVLHNAVHGEQSKLVEWFIRQGHNLNVQNGEGYTHSIMPAIYTLLVF
jgi:hypothetical protein